MFDQMAPGSAAALFGNILELQVKWILGDNTELIFRVPQRKDGLWLSIRTVAARHSDEGHSIYFNGQI